MSEEDKKVIENLLNINPINISYEQLVSMQNGWWETLKLLSEQNKENKQIKDQLQQKENIIKEVREWAKKYSCQFTNDDGELVVSEISFNIQARPCDLFKILDKGE